VKLNFDYLLDMAYFSRMSHETNPIKTKGLNLKIIRLHTIPKRNEIQNRKVLRYLSTCHFSCKVDLYLFSIFLKPIRHELHNHK